MSGWNRPDDRTVPVKRPAKPLLRHGIFAGLVVVALGLAALFMLSNGDVTPAAESKEKSKAIKEVKPACGSLKTDKGNHTANSKDIVAAVEGISQENAGATNPEAGVSVAPSNTVVVFEKHGFKTGAEQVLASVFMTEPGDMPPPLPTISFNSEADLIRHIDEMYEIKVDDSDRQKDVKETLNAVKKELSEYMRNGGDVNSFLDFYDKQLNEAREFYLATKREIARVMVEEDMTPEQTIQYVRRLNKMLSEKGVKSVRLNKSDLDELHVTQEELEN